MSYNIEKCIDFNIKDDWGKYLEYVEENALNRAKAQGWRYIRNGNNTYQSENEVEFLLGAMAIFFYIAKKDGKDYTRDIPLLWLTKVVSRQSIFSNKTLKEHGLIPKDH